MATITLYKSLGNCSKLLKKFRRPGWYHAGMNVKYASTLIELVTVIKQLCNEQKQSVL